jgi:hypothetical protein
MPDDTTNTTNTNATNDNDIKGSNTEDIKASQPLERKKSWSEILFGGQPVSPPLTF